MAISQLLSLPPAPRYPIHSSRIGIFLRNAEQMTLQSGVPKRLMFKPAFIAEGVFKTLYEQDTQKSKTYTDLYDLIRQGVRIDYHIDIEYAPDITNDRGVTMYLDYIYPSDTDKYDLPLDTFTIGTRSAAASKVGYTNTVFQRLALNIPILDPFDDVPYTYALYVDAVQNSGGPLLMDYAELALIAYG
jgi:hypothetical protein